LGEEWRKLKVTAASGRPAAAAAVGMIFGSAVVPLATASIENNCGTEDIASLQIRKEL
jgi:hypothetical protein